MNTWNRGSFNRNPLEASPQNKTFGTGTEKIIRTLLDVEAVG